MVSTPNDSVALTMVFELLLARLKVSRVRVIAVTSAVKSVSIQVSNRWQQSAPLSILS